jgi:hypothetical protein
MNQWSWVGVVALVFVIASAVFVFLDVYDIVSIDDLPDRELFAKISICVHIAAWVAVCLAMYKKASEKETTSQTNQFSNLGLNYSQLHVQ